MANTNLHKAKSVKNDEFYTQLSDIEKEVWHYKSYFKGKVVFLNCDDPEYSEFWSYFSLNFNFLGLKKLISTHYHKEHPTYKLELINGVEKAVKTSLQQNGDFRSPESIALLEEADIVITNPPFSLFREYIDLLMKHEKKFLVVGPLLAIDAKNIFPHIKENRIWLGVNTVKEFRQPGGEVKKFGNVVWFTNLSHNKQLEKFIPYLTYKEEEAIFYDNYDAIEIGKVKNIPKNCPKIMGVPVSFMQRYNKTQFEIVGQTNTADRTTVTNDLRKDEKNRGRGIVKGNTKQPRILIKWKQ